MEPGLFLYYFFGGLDVKKGIAPQRWIATGLVLGLPRPKRRFGPAGGVWIIRLRYGYGIILLLLPSLVIDDLLLLAHHLLLIFKLLPLHLLHLPLLPFPFHTGVECLRTLAYCANCKRRG